MNLWLELYLLKKVGKKFEPVKPCCPDDLSPVAAAFIVIYIALLVVFVLVYK